MSGAVTIELSGDEALVLFEWLAGLEAAKVPIGEAEQTVLWRIEAALEKSLVEPFAKDYAELVEKARQRVLATRGSPNGGSKEKPESSRSAWRAWSTRILSGLVSASYAEDQGIDYKEELPDLDGKKPDDARKKLLADVAAFANAGGGDILFGVEEGRADGKPNGIPVSLPGIEAPTPMLCTGVGWASSRAGSTRRWPRRSAFARSRSPTARGRSSSCASPAATRPRTW